MEKKRFRLATLGCRTNQYETEAYRKQLQELGYEEAKGDEEASVCIVNSCTVTEMADRSSFASIRRLQRENPEARVLVTGCLTESKGGALRELEGIEVVSNLEKEDLIGRLTPEEDLPEFSIEQFEGHSRAFVKVQDGCNSFCTYCVIPYVRGRSRSRECKEILVEVQRLVDQGYQEVVITGINVGDFDGSQMSLADLIREVDRIEGLKRIRISSIDPDEVDEEFADAILSGQKTCHSLHLVLQSGSNAILKRMNRKYTKQIFCKTVQDLRDRDPDFTFTTDVIVGFPGETEGDFQETLDLMREVRFAKVHMFPYSRRPRTRAALYTDQVPLDVQKRRKQAVLHLAEQLTFDLQGDFVGRTMEILTENESKKGWSSGHTANFLKVCVEQEIAPNQLVTVRLTENTPLGLIGEVVL